MKIVRHDEEISYSIINLGSLSRILRDNLAFLLRELKKLNLGILKNSQIEDVAVQLANKLLWILIKRFGIYYFSPHGNGVVIIKDCAKKLIDYINSFINTVRDIITASNEQADIPDASVDPQSIITNVDTLEHSLRFDIVTERSITAAFALMGDDPPLSYAENNGLFVSSEKMREIFDNIYKTHKKPLPGKTIIKRIPGFLIRFGTKHFGGRKLSDDEIVLCYDTKIMGIEFIAKETLTGNSVYTLRDLYDISLGLAKKIIESLDEYRYTIIFALSLRNKMVYIPAYNRFYSRFETDEKIILNILLALLMLLAFIRIYTSSSADIILIRRIYLRPSKSKARTIHEWKKECNEIVFPLSERQNIDSHSLVRRGFKYVVSDKLADMIIEHLNKNLALNFSVDPHSKKLCDFSLLFDKKLKHDIVWLGGEPIKKYLKPTMDLQILADLLNNYGVDICLIPIFLTDNPSGKINKIKQALRKIESYINSYNLPISLFKLDGNYHIASWGLQSFINMIRKEIDDSIENDEPIHYALHRLLQLEQKIDPQLFTQCLPHPDITKKRRTTIYLIMHIIDDEFERDGDLSYVLSRILSIAFDIPILPVRYTTLDEEIAQKSGFNRALLNNIIRCILARSHLLPLDFNQISTKTDTKMESITHEDLQDWLFISVSLYNLEGKFGGLVACLAWIQSYDDIPFFRHRAYFTLKKEPPQTMEEFLEELAKVLRKLRKLFERYENVIIELPYVMEQWRTKIQKTYLARLLDNVFRDVEENENMPNIYIILRGDVRMPRLFEIRGNIISVPNEDIYFVSKDAKGNTKNILFGVSSVILGDSKYRLPIPRKIVIYKFMKEGQKHIVNPTEEELLLVMSAFKASKMLRLNTPIHVVKETTGTLATIKYRHILHLVYKLSRDQSYRFVFNSVYNLLDKLSRIRHSQDSLIILDNAGIWALI